jgi:hypothetical protein
VHADASAGMAWRDRHPGASGRRRHLARLPVRFGRLDVMKRLLTVLALSTLGLANLTGVAAAQPIGVAQRIFQGIEHFDPDDTFAMTAAEVEEAPIAVESFADFACLMCSGPYRGSFTIDWYRSKEAAAFDALSRAALETSFPYTMFYLAGRAEMTGPAPSRIVKAFGDAVGDQVVIVEPYCCGYANPTLPTG